MISAVGWRAPIFAGPIVIAEIATSVPMTATMTIGEGRHLVPRKTDVGESSMGPNSHNWSTRNSGTDYAVVASRSLRRTRAVPVATTTTVARRGSRDRAVRSEVSDAIAPIRGGPRTNPVHPHADTVATAVPG